jgi:hypothetical protein
MQSVSVVPAAGAPAATATADRRLAEVEALAGLLPEPTLAELLAGPAAADSSWPTWHADEVVTGLFQGGTAGGATVRDPAPGSRWPAVPEHDLVVTLYADAQPADWGVEELRYGFPDAGLTPQFAERVVRLARHAHQRWLAGDDVLVRCQAGVNRSGLVTTLVLMLAGLSAGQAITLIRARRSPWALCNGRFVEWAVEHGAQALGLPPTGEPAAQPSAA